MYYCHVFVIISWRSYEMTMQTILEQQPKASSKPSKQSGPMCSGWTIAMMKSVSGWNHIPTSISSNPECFLNPNDIRVYIHCVRYFFNSDVMYCLLLLSNKD